MCFSSDQFRDWFQFSWVGDGPYSVHEATKEPIPHGFNVTKGSTHMAVTREFVEFAVNDPRAQDLLYWMRNIKVPDEHFFQTLNHNPQMNIPGSFLGQSSQVKSSQVAFNEPVSIAHVLQQHE